MRPQPLPSRRPTVYDRTATVIYLTGPGDDVVIEHGPRTPAIEFAHRLPGLAGQFVISMGGCFAFVLAVAVILGFRL